MTPAKRKQAERERMKLQGYVSFTCYIPERDRQSVIAHIAKLRDRFEMDKLRGSRNA